jgi:hypothetical protein
VFFDAEAGQFGLTTGGVAEQTRFDTLEDFVEGIAETFGGEQLRDGRFNADAIAAGRTPNGVRDTDDGVLIRGRSVSRRFQFKFEDRETAAALADGCNRLFDLIAESGALAQGDRLFT